MPSRPMFTMPERSAKRPPSPAKSTGTAHRNISRETGVEVNLSVSPMLCTMVSSSMPASA